MRNSEIILCNNINLDKDYRNVLDYSEEQMLSLCKSKAVAIKNDYSFIRTTGEILVDFTYEQCLNANYIAFQNKDYSNKWFFAWIDNVNYSSDSATKITYVIDAWSTWFSKLQIGKSFVLREHVIDDSIGANTFPENLETGEYIANSVYVDPTLNNVLNDTCYVIGASVDLNLTSDKFDYAGGNSYNGVYSGVKYFYFSRSAQGGINAQLKKVAENGQADTITGLFIVPKVLAPATADGGAVESSATPQSWDISVAKTYGLNGYTPKNNKLYTHPYCYLIASNMAGSTNIYHYEDFSDNNCNFNVKGVLCPGASIRMTPRNYKGIASNDLESLMLGKFPICNYQVDMYTNWLTQNSVNVGGNTVTSDDLNIANASVGAISGVIGSLLSGNIGGAITGAVSGGTSIASALIGQKQHELIPPSVRGDLNSGDVVTADSKNNFRFFRMSIKKEYAEKIDDYFTRFGYQVNKLKTPNINTRTYWNYIQISDSDDLGFGNIPTTFIESINSIARRGVTIWHNHDNIGNYSLNNVNK